MRGQSSKIQIVENNEFLNSQGKEGVKGKKEKKGSNLQY
jgi:hypothetical protein